jgi:hypothetical protein
VKTLTEKFDLKKLINMDVSDKVIVTERNKPNFDRMAKAFFQFLNKR